MTDDLSRYRSAEAPSERDGPPGLIIYDRENPHAWIRSSRFVGVGEPAGSEPEWAMEYDPLSRTYHLRYDWRERQPLSAFLVDALAHVTGERPSGGEAIFDGIEPAALDRLFSPGPDGSFGADGPVSLGYRDHEVIVDRHGEIRIRRRVDDE